MDLSVFEVAQGLIAELEPAVGGDPDDGALRDGSAQRDEVAAEGGAMGLAMSSHVLGESIPALHDNARVRKGARAGVEGRVIRNASF